ncbi:MAG TPA: hypothetical protein VK106_06245, partial [Balneolaceae bacterium]|nr:hypothetical protein [Balneolaceae bacterium]
MKHFVTLFPEAKNIHLIKDVGQIPYQMQHLFNYNASLVCYKNGSYPYLNEKAKELNISFLENTGKTFYWDKAPLKFLYKNAKKIDILNLY